MPLHLLLVAVLAAGAPAGLAAPQKKEYAMKLVSSAENSSLNWRAQYRYIEDIHDGRGYTAGIIGFCSGTGDMLEVVRAFTRAKPHNGLRALHPGAAARQRKRFAHGPREALRGAPGGARRRHGRCAAPRTPSATASTSTRP